MLIFIWLAQLFFIETQNNNLATLSIQVTGIENATGTVRVGVFDNEDAFPKQGRYYKAVVKKIESKTPVVTLELPKGKKYGIAAFHDANANGKMDKNVMGLPLENYGFSNNARANFSAPSFSDAAIFLNGDLSITIRLK